jgi:heme a synthase
MVTDTVPHTPLITQRHRRLLLAASIMTCLLVAMGGIVCATESGSGCPDWPGCYGRIVPPPQVNAIIEYTHRLIAALTTPLILAAAVVSWRKTRALRWVSWPMALVLVFLFAVIVFGALTVLTGLPRGLAALDLGTALIVLALVVTATTVAYVRRDVPDLPDRLSADSALARFSLFALITVFALHVSGVLVAGKGSLTRCLGWPMWRILPDDLAVWSQAIRLSLAALAGFLIVTLVIRAWRMGQNQALRKVAATVAATFLIEMLLTVVMLTLGTNPYLLIAYVVAATLLWTSLVVITVHNCATTQAQLCTVQQ